MRPPIPHHPREFAKFMFIESVIPSNHLIFCCSLLLLPSLFPSIRVLFSELAIHIKCTEHWSINFTVNPSSEYSGLISFKSDSQESSPAPQFKSISSSVFCLLFGPTLTSILDYWKGHSSDYMDLYRQSDVFAF